MGTCNWRSKSKKYPSFRCLNLLKDKNYFMGLLTVCCKKYPLVASSGLLTVCRKKYPLVASSGLSSSPGLLEGISFTWMAIMENVLDLCCCYYYGILTQAWKINGLGYGDDNVNAQ